jgi:hypothetical protein
VNDRPVQAPEPDRQGGPPPYRMKESLRPMPPQAARPLTADAPLLAAFRATASSGDTPFCVPGHKHRAGALDADLGFVSDADVPLYAGLDTMKLTGGLLPRAEAMAAQRWGADWCRFSVGGATQANQALLCWTPLPARRRSGCLSLAAWARSRTSPRWPRSRTPAACRCWWTRHEGRISAFTPVTRCMR